MENFIKNNVKSSWEWIIKFLNTSSTFIEQEIEQETSCYLLFYLIRHQQKRFKHVKPASS